MISIKRDDFDGGKLVCPRCRKGVDPKRTSVSFVSMTSWDPIGGGDRRGSYQTGVDTVGNPTSATWSHRFDYQGFGSCLSRVGVDSNRAPSSDWSTDAFSATALRWRDSTNFDHTGWNTSEYWIENPCGSAPTCLNGLYYGSSRWDSNKP